MFKLTIKESVNEKIDEFVKANLDKLKKFFDDIWDSDSDSRKEICSFFEKELNKKVYFEIEKMLKEDVVYESRSSENKLLLVVVSVWINRLFVTYTEDESNKTRVAIDIEFYKEFKFKTETEEL